MILFLIGFMGSGKSHYAKQLSSYLEVPCYDLDTEIELFEGKQINQIFAEKGEDYFRLLESEILKKTVVQINAASQIHHNINNNIFAVVACGGGTPCFHGNMEWMNQQGLTIWINPPLEVLVKRLENEKAHRPLIKEFTKKEMEDFIRQKLEDRASFYSLAKVSIEDPTIEVEQIIKTIGNASSFL